MVLITQYSFGQQFTNIHGDYLGQTPPGDTPVIFAPGIISGNALEHSVAAFSPDANEVYWASRNNQSAPLHVWYMKRINNRWTKPEVFAPLGDSTGCYDPFFSTDGKRLYFGADNNGNADIWFVEKKDGGWSKPRILSPIINTAIDGQCQAAFTNDGTIYYIDYKIIENKWTCDILRSKFINNEYQRPDTLPPSINSTSEGWTPYITPNESYLLFASRRRNPGIPCDLYISFHDVKKDTWTEPVNMGEPINTDAQETFPMVSPDGKYLFFTRWTNETSGMDIYWVSATIIDRLKEKMVQENKTYYELFR